MAEKTRTDNERKKELKEIVNWLDNNDSNAKGYKDKEQQAQHLYELINNI